MRVCPEPGCPNFQPCEEHKRKPWATGNRHPRPRGKGWMKRKARILRRDERICYVCHRPGADQVDHKLPLFEGGTDDDSNLGAIHEMPCHKRKTQEESRRARGVGETH